MKVNRKLLLSLLVVFTILVPLFSPITAEAAAIGLNKATAIMEKSSYMKLKLNGTKKTPKWSSSDTGVLKVSQKGTVKAVGVGEAAVIARLGKAVYVCTITVVDSASAINLKHALSADYYIITISEESYVNIMVKDPGEFSLKVTSIYGDSVSYYWGEPQGYLVPLFFTLNKTGESAVTISAGYSNGTSETIQIHVNVVDYESSYENTAAKYFSAPRCPKDLVSGWKLTQGSKLYLL